MDVDADNERHRREEEDRKEKRRQKRKSENKSEAQKDREERRQAHTKKMLEQYNKSKGRSGKPPPPPPPSSKHKNQSRYPNKKSSKSRPPPPSSTTPSSKFQALFAKRAKGFLIDLNFRNAPPRPPVGPCFVGLGLEGELNDKWTRYKPDNAIERKHIWKLHAEPDLGVPLAPSAMDYEGCYFDPTKNDDAPVLPPKLHPDDAKIIDWTGDDGDSVLKELQRRRLRARAIQSGRGGQAGSLLSSSKSNKPSPFVSRVLRGDDAYFMKKTTYLANDQGSSVHKFTSLQKTKTMNAMAIQQQMKENRRKFADKDMIAEAFTKANQSPEPRAKHPVKKGVEAVFEIPFLPDAQTWGHTYTHVVVDHLPKTIVPIRKRKKKQKNGPVTRRALEKAFVADIAQPGENVRVECNLLLPAVDPPPPTEAGGKEGDVLYDASMSYDLDVQPLIEEGKACVNYLIAIDEKNGVATYHPVTSRIQLSSGRMPGSRDGDGATGKRKRLRRFVGRRPMGSEEVNEMEARLGEIDRDYGGHEEEEEEDAGAMLSESDDSE